jgi:hypothetical protein
MVLFLGILTDGRETILYPQNEKLLSADGDYLELKHGDQVEVDFRLPRGFAARKYVLVASGYYIPYSKAVDSPARNPRHQANKRD